MTDGLQRSPHAALGRGGRLRKAQKIYHLLEPEIVHGRTLRLLEIGTGSGFIAHYFATHPNLDCRVESVDVVDLRQIVEGYHFQQVSGTALPFANGEFDIVISNHVIEHVGNRDDQAQHLSELARVLAPTGQAYVATPNRWQIVEPHYRIAFLSWLPRGWRSTYLRQRGRGLVYDCDPLSMAELQTLFQHCRLQFKNCMHEAIAAMIVSEGNPRLPMQIAARLPHWITTFLLPLSPTHIYLVRHAQTAVAG